MVIDYKNEYFLHCNDTKRYLNQGDSYPNHTQSWENPLLFGKITQERTTIKKHNVIMKFINANNNGNLEFKRTFLCRTCSESFWKFEINENTIKNIEKDYQKEYNDLLKKYKNKEKLLKNFFQNLREKYPENIISVFVKEKILKVKTNNEIINKAQHELSKETFLNQKINKKKNDIINNINGIKAFVEAIPKQTIFLNNEYHHLLSHSPYIAMEPDMHRPNLKEIRKKHPQISSYVNNVCKGGEKKEILYSENAKVSFIEEGTIFYSSLNKKEEAFPPFISIENDDPYNATFMEDEKE